MVGRIVALVIFSLFAVCPSDAIARGVKQGHQGHGHNKSIPPAPRSGIDHIVVVMMENRSFDHFLGWHPTADAMQERLAYVDRDGALQATYPLAPDYQGCGHPDPDHSWQGGREQYNGGAMDGFLVSGDNDEYAIGYYVEADRPFFSALAREYTVADRFFSSILGPTYPNRIFQHSAQTDRLENTLDFSTLPTIWDRLAEAEVSARYYFSDVSFLWLWGLKYLPIHSTYDQFLLDAANGTLPSVSFVEPRFVEDISGTSGSDHPFGDIRTGDAFLAQTFHAVANGPAWANTVFIITYDEWGGFFEHVAPPRAAAPNNVDPDIVGGKALLGMRVPVIIASPFTRGDPNNPRVVSTVFDHTSILKLIEWRWNLRPLTARDASSDVGNLVAALDFDHPSPNLPDLPLPAPPPLLPCLPPFPGEVDIGLADLILLNPF
ncbi:MAG TPA: alkaline phosphatase family protein [Terriglobales bacterium]|nr:alkaline phosphatase family protein [Terriglobales bacterium]